MIWNLEIYGGHGYVLPRPHSRKELSSLLLGELSVRSRQLQTTSASASVSLGHFTHLYKDDPHATIADRRGVLKVLSLHPNLPTILPPQILVWLTKVICPESQLGFSFCQILLSLPTSSKGIDLKSTLMPHIGLSA